MWRTYFPRARVYGIDIYDKSAHDERRIKTFRGSQVDFAFLNRVLEEIGAVHIIIDDGSHLNEHVIKTFEYLFPRLATPGIYAIEDTQTAYWKKFGGTSTCLNQADTSMGFLKRLVDGINFRYFAVEGYQPNYYDEHIVSMHFYRNLVLVEKGENTKCNRCR
jgi:demethylmacrocin O-methyltransferase